MQIANVKARKKALRICKSPFKYFYFADELQKVLYLSFIRTGFYTQQCRNFSR